MALREEASIPFTPAGEAIIRYVLGTRVPDNWIPFVPLHMEASAAEIHLQRAQMPGAKGTLGTLLTEKLAPYFIYEEKVPRSGLPEGEMVKWKNLLEDGQTERSRKR